MSEAKKRCRHKDAWPTIYGGEMGYFWCPDCGATRQARVLAPNSIGTRTNDVIAYTEFNWIYPRGKEDVLEQMERSREI